MIKNKRVLILMYHMITKTNHPYEKRYALSPERFRRQMLYLKKNGYTSMSLDDLQRYFAARTGSLPEKPVIITFDDGYLDNYERAFPILRECNFSATVFVVTGHVGIANRWMRSGGYPERPLMGWREIEEIKKHGITIGSHTVNHRCLKHLSLKDVKTEIEDSKKLLEDRLGVPVNHFAYPYGDTNRIIVNVIKECGYKTACSTKSGFNTSGINLFELRRLEIYGTDSIWRFAIKLTYGTNDGNLLLPARYYVKRLTDKVTQRSLA